MFRVFDSLSINSFKKKNIVSMSYQLVLDTQRLQSFLKRLFYLRVLSNKLLLLSYCVKCSSNSIRTISEPLCSFLKQLSFLIVLYSTFTLSIRRAVQHTLYIYNASFLNSFLLPVFSYLLYMSYYRYLLSYIFYFLTSSLFRRKCNGVATLPTRIKRYTVLRSPHSDKKSREQFELRTHKRVFKFPSCFSSYYNYTCFMQNSMFLCTYKQTSIKQLYDSF